MTLSAPEPTPPLTDDSPTSDRDKADMIAARREVQAVLDGLPMDNGAYSAAIMMTLWRAGWRPRHLPASMDRCDIADGWWRIGQQWRQKCNEALAEVDRLRAELAEANKWIYWSKRNAASAAEPPSVMAEIGAERARQDEKWGEQNPPCHPIIVHTYGLTREAEDKLFDRIADAAHENDETLSCSGGNECHLCEDERPEPDWADVREAARKAGITIAKSERISPYWRHRALVRRGVEAGDWAINTTGSLRNQHDHWISLYGRDGWFVEMKNPTPAKVLESARFLGLDGGTP